MEKYKRTILSMLYGIQYLNNIDDTYGFLLDGSFKCIEHNDIKGLEKFLKVITRDLMRKVETRDELKHKLIILSPKSYQGIS